MRLSKKENPLEKMLPKKQSQSQKIGIVDGVQRDRVSG